MSLYDIFGFTILIFWTLFILSLTYNIEIVFKFKTSLVSFHLLMKYKPYLRKYSFPTLGKFSDIEIVNVIVILLSTFSDIV